MENEVKTKKNKTVVIVGILIVIIVISVAFLIVQKLDEEANDTALNDASDTLDDSQSELAYHETCDDETFACSIAKLYSEDGVNGLYYHDGVGDYDNATYEAGDNSYRYAGASADVNNYVCFGSTADTCSDDYLYRIIGVFDDGDGYQVKLIKYENATSELLGTDGDYITMYAYTWWPSDYQGSISISEIGAYNWNSENYIAIGSTTYYNVWSGSELNTVNLNTNFLNNIGETWSSLIEDYTWKVGGMAYTNVEESPVKTAYQYEILNPNEDIEEEITAKVGLMYVTDYGYAAAPTYWTTNLGNYDDATDDNWMYMGLHEWTISRKTNLTSYGVSDAFIVYCVGSVGSTEVYYDDFAVRPSFYLKASVELSGGTGTQTDPYRIKI